MAMACGCLPPPPPPPSPPNSRAQAAKRIEQSDSPLAAVVLRQSEDVVHPEDLFLVATSGQKLRTFNLDTQTARKTTLAPTFGGSLGDLLFLPTYTPDVMEGEEGEQTPALPAPADHVNPKYLAFSAGQSVGLLRLPLSGNPHAAMGVIAHPTGVAGLVRSYDGTFLLSAGTHDAVIHLWRVRTDVLEAQHALRGRGIEPFLELADPSGLGRDGPFFKDMHDYFLYAQLRAQGEERSASRVIEERVALKQVPLIMQAMGFFPTAQETDDMLSEVKHRHFVEAGGKTAYYVSLEELIQRRCGSL
jgi:hypothetical protein